MARMKMNRRQRANEVTVVKVSRLVAKAGFGVSAAKAGSISASVVRVVTADSVVLVFLEPKQMIGIGF